VVFRGTQASDQTPNESFILGNQEGDDYNFLTGSLTGTLSAGHRYVFYYDAWMEQNTPLSSSFATATGYVQLTIVPEPSTAILVGLGLASFATRLSRRSTRLHS
jgi:hypothetical protein